MNREVIHENNSEDKNITITKFEDDKKISVKDAKKLILNPKEFFT